jgi:hemolysin III
LRDPISALTHFVGALLSVAGLVLLIRAAIARGTPWHVASFAIFGASLILLYSASAVYHWLPVPERVHRILRRVDHTMIFVLIAGSYTPFCLVPLRGAWGWSLFGVAWTVAAAGVILSILWIEAPRWLYTGLYVAMGWMIVVAIAPLIRSVPAGGMAWFAAGGLFYTVGAAMYAFKWPNPFPKVFGFHEIWHLFVMAGSFSHFWVVLRYLT